MRPKLSPAFRAARATIEAMGMTLELKEDAYRVNFKGEDERLAIYSNSLRKAVNFAHRMRQDRDDDFGR